MKSKKILISFIILFAILFIQTKSNAAVAINGAGEWYNITVSNSYAACYNMRNGATSTLGNNNLDPHLSLNADWGAVAYLAASDYGTVRDSYGANINITNANGPSTISGNKEVRTTTSNASGVMDFGKYYAQTASLVSGNSTNYTSNLNSNLNTKYVENLGDVSKAEESKGQSFAETSGWFGSSKYFPSSNFPVSIRTGVFGAFSSDWTGSYYSQVYLRNRSVLWGMYLPSSYLE